MLSFRVDAVLRRRRLSHWFQIRKPLHVASIDMSCCKSFAQCFLCLFEEEEEKRQKHKGERTNTISVDARASWLLCPLYIFLAFDRLLLLSSGDAVEPDICVAMMADAAAAAVPYYYSFFFFFLFFFLFPSLLFLSFSSSSFSFSISFSSVSSSSFPFFCCRCQKGSFSIE